MAKKEDISTIKIAKKTKERLGRLKIHEKESYDKAIQKILDILNTLRNEPLRARMKLVKLDQIRQKIKEN